MVFSNANTKRTIISISAAQTASKTAIMQTIDKLSKPTSIFKSLTLLLMGLAFFVSGVMGQISITSLPASYGNNFNSYNPTTLANTTSTLISTGTGSGLASATSGGWTFTNAPGNYNGRSTGTGTTGGVYGFGSGSEFCLGMQRSGTAPNEVSHTVSFTNNSGVTITSLTIAWDYEQWRFANTSGIDVTGTGALSTNTTLNSKDFTGTSSGTSGTVAVTSVTSFTLNGLSITNGTSFGITWITVDASGSDNGIGIDNFSLSATASSNYYWNGGTPANSPVTGGSGTWTTANAWRTVSTSGSEATWADNNSAFLGSSAGTVTLGSSVSPTSTTINTTGYTFATSGSSAITLGGGIDIGGATSQTTTFAPIAAAPLTLSGVISNTNAANLTFAGAGTTTLSGTNTYTGINTITSGTLSVAGDANLGAAPGSATANSISLNGGTLATTSTLTTTANRGITLNTSTSSTIDVASGTTLTVNGIIAGSGNLTKTNSGTLTFNGANTNTGTITVNAGTLKASAANKFSGSSGIVLANTAGVTLDLTTGTTHSVGSLSGGGTTGGNVTLNTGVTLTIGGDNTSPAAYAGVMSSAGNAALIKTGTGALTLSGSSTFPGTTTISGGSIIVGADALSGSASPLGGAFNNTTTLGNAATATNNSSPSLLTGGAFTISKLVTIANQATSGTYSIGGNTDNNSTFSGAITLNQPLTISQVATTGSNTLTISGGISGTAQNVTVNNAGSVLINSAIATTTGTLTKSGSGTLTLSGANTYTGTTTISAGTLALSGSGLIALSTNIILGSGGTFDVSGRSNSLILGSSQIFTALATGSNTTGSITLSSTKGLTLSGAGGLVFSAYGGGATAPLTVNGASGVLDLNGTPITVTTTTALAIGTYKLISKGTSSGVSGIIGALTINGSGLAAGTIGYLSNVSGELILTVALPSYTSIVSGGDWNTAATWSLNSGGNGVPAAGSIVVINTNVTASATPTNQVSSITVNNGFTLSLNAAYTNPSGGTITVNSGGTLALGAALTNTGSTSISTGGTLQLNASGTISTAPTYAGTATLVYNQGGSVTTSVEWNAGSATVGVGEPNNVTIQNNTTVTQAAARFIGGTTTVASGATLNTGAFTFTGGTATNINGTFQINQGGYATGGTWNYGTTGTLVYNNTSGTYGPIDAGHVYWPSSNSPINVTVQGGGAINMGVARTVTGTFLLVTGANAIQGTALTLNGTVQINGGNFQTTPTYGSASTLIYNTSYGTSNEWTGGASTTVAAGSGVPANVQILSGTVTLAGGRGVPGSVSISSGANLTLNASAGDLYVGGNFSQGGTLTHSNRAVFLVLANTQTITGTLNGTSTINCFPYLIVNKTGGGITLSTPVNVTNTLTLTSGVIASSGANILTITATGTGAISGGSTSAYINGTLARALPSGLASGFTYSYPVGSASTYLPFALVNPTTSGTATATVTAFGTAPTGTSDNSTITALSTTEYWTLATTANFTNTTVNLTRQSTISPFNAIAVSTTNAASSYSSLAGTVGASAVTGSNLITTGGATQFLCFGTKITSNPPTINSSGGIVASSPGASLSGYVGNTVTINGTFLTGITIVKVGGSSGVSATILSQNGSTLTFAAPPGTYSSGQIYVQNVVGNALSTETYTNNGYISTAAGDWNTTGTWLGGALPLASSPVTIATAVTLNAAVTNAPSTLTINGSQSLAFGASGTLTVNNTVTTTGTLNMSSGGTLFMAASSTFTNNGSFTTGGTVYFAGAGTVNGSVATTFNNLTINTGALTLTTAPTINGSFTINGGFVTAAPIYGSSSTLIYNSTYGTGNEWTGGASTSVAAGTGIPANVTITTGTVTLGGGRGVPGTLTVNSACGFVLNATSGDLYIGGSLTNNGSTWTNNGRAVFFVGTGTSVITNGSGTQFFDYLVNQKTTGSVQLAASTNVTLNTTSGNVLQFLNAGTLDLNGNILTLNNAGGNILVDGANGGTAKYITSSSAATIAITNTKTASANNLGTLSIGANITVVLTGGMNFGAGVTTTINGTLRINTNGGVTTNPPAYGSGSLLLYNSGTTYGRSTEWTAASGTVPTTPGTGTPGYPFNVQISNATTLNVPNGSTQPALGIANNLTVDASSAFYQDFGTPTTSNTVVVGGSVLNNGAISLGNNFNGDINIAGNFTQNGTFIPNGRAIFFTGAAASTQTISASSSPVTIPYIVMGSAGNTVQLSNTSILATAINGGNAINFGSSASNVFDLNGYNITIGTVGQTCNFTGSGFFKGHANSSMTIQGTTTTGNVGFVSTQQLSSLTVNLTAGGATLSSPLTTATLAMTAGSLSLNGNAVSVTSALSGTGTINNNNAAAATFTVSSGTANTFSGTLADGATGTLALTKSGAGTLTLSGNNTYTGATANSSSGAISISGTNASAITNSSTAILSGTGSTTAAVNIASGTFLSPAGSGTRGTLTTGALTLNGTYTFDINSLPSGTSGTNWDYISSTTLTTTGFTLAISGTMPSFVASTSYQWKIGAYSSTLTASGVYSVNTAGLTGVTPTGIFSVTISGGFINLNYTAPTITISSQSASASSLVQNTTNNNIYTLVATSTGATNTVTAISFFGTYSATTDFTNFKLFYNTTGTFSTGTLLGTVSSIPASGSAITFSGLSQTIAVGTPGYFYLSTDIPCAAVTSNNMTISAIITSNVTTTANLLGSASAGSSLSIAAPAAPANATSLAATTAAGQSVITWAAPVAPYCEVMLVANTASTSATPSGNGTAYTANSQVFTDGSNTTFSTTGKVVYKGTGTTATITGLTNGTLYYYELFTRNGISWSSGVEVSATPVLTPVALGNYPFTGTSCSVAAYTAASVVSNLTYSNISTTGISCNSNVSSAFSGSSSWGTGFSSGKYIEFTLTPASSYNLSLSSLVFDVWRSSAGATNYSVRTSIDGYVSDIASGSATTSQTPISAISLSAAGYQSLSSAITFRVYAWGGGSSGDFRMDNIILNGNVVQAAPPTQLVITSISPTSPTATSGFSVTLQAQDGTGTASSTLANTAFTLTTNGNAGTIGGTTTGTITAGSNSVTVTGVTLSTSGTGATVTATRTSGDNLTASTSSSFNVLAAATQMAFVSVPSTGVSGSNLTSFAVEARRPDNTLDNTYSGSITISKATGSGSLSGTLSVNAFAGVATFSAAQFSAAGTYTLYANASGLSQATSGSIVVSTPSSTSDYFRSISSGNWGSTSTWQSSPDGSTWQTSTLIPTTTANTVTIQSGHTVTVAASVTADNLTIASGGILTINSSQTLTIANGTGTDLTVTGTLNNNGSLTLQGTTSSIIDGTFNNAGTLTLNTTTTSLTVNGTWNQNTGSSISLGGVSAVIAFNAASAYNHGIDGGVIPTSTWNTTSTCTVTGVTTTAPTGLTQSFGNFTWNCAAQSSEVSLGGALNTVNGNFTVQTTNYSDLFIGLTGSGNLTVGGDIILNSGSILNGTQTAARTITATNLTMADGSYFALASESAINTAGSSAAGILTLNLNGNLTLTGSAEINFSYNFNYTSYGYGNINLKGNLSTILSTGRNFYTSSVNSTQGNGIITFNGTGGSVSSPQTINLHTPSNVEYTNFVVNSGAFVQLNSGVQLSVYTTSIFRGSFTVNNGGTLNFQGNTVSINTTSNYNSGGTYFINFTAASGSSLITSHANGFGSTGSVVVTSQVNASFNSAANYEFRGATTGTFTTTPTASTVNNLTINSSGTTLSQPLTVTGTATLTAGILTTTSTNLLTISNTANSAITGGSTTAYINGPVTWTLGASSTGTYTVPVGASSKYYPLAFAVGTIASGSPTIRVTPNATGAGSADGTTLNATSGAEYWTIVTTGSTFAATSFSLGRSTPALGNMNAIGRSTTNAASSYTSIAGTIGTLSSQPSVNASTSGLSGAGTLYLALAQSRVTVTFNSNGGSAVTAITTAYNTTITLPTAPTRTGYTFAGWFTDNTTFTTAFTASTAVVANITVFAKWTGIAGNWVGATSTDWNTTTNWADGIVPSSGANVTINAGTTFPPILNVDATVGNLVVATGTALSVGAKTLTLNGTYNSGGQLGTIAATTAGNTIFNGTAGNVYFTPTFSTFNNITVNTGATVNLVNTVSNSGTFTLAGGTLTVGVAETLGNFTQSGGTLNVLAATTLGNFSKSGGALNINTGVNLTLSGTYSGSGGSITNGGTITLTGGNKTFPGNSVTFPTVSVAGQTLATMNNLTVNLTSPTNVITWSTPNATMVIAGRLTLSSGLITTTLTNNLSIQNPATGLSGGSASSYINGPLGIGYFGNSITGTYPIGAGGNYRPVQFTYTNCLTCTTSPNIVIIQQNEGAYPALSSSYSTARFGSRYYTVIQNPASYAYTMNIDNNGGTATGTPKAFVWEYDANSVLATTSNITASPTSSYYAFSFSPTATSNYINYVELTETAIPLTITASNQSKTYGVALSPLNASPTPYTVTGLVGSDALSSVTLTNSNTSNSNSPATDAPGSYDITPSNPAFSTGAISYYSPTYTKGTLTVSAGTVGSWLGLVSTDYNNVSNWQSYSVPLASSNITIPASGITNYPVLSGATTLNNLTINSGTLGLNGQTLTVNGAISGTGTITPTAASSLVIGGNAGTINFTNGSNTIKDLTLNSSATATLGGTTNISAGATPGTVTIASGATLNTGGNLVIKSDASGTARIAQSAGSISGNVTVERFITAKPARRFSFVGTPVTQSVRNAWQQQIYVTGPGTGGQPCGTTTGNAGATDKYNSNGFDATLNGSNTIQQYTATLSSKNSRYSGIASTDISLTPGTGYSVNIRGNRNSATVTCDNQLNSLTPTAPEAVTLSASGTVTTGDLTVALNDFATHKFTLLANPYPSQISFAAFKADNATISNKLWTYSPFSSTGAFTTYTKNPVGNGYTLINGATNYDGTSGDFIASGQAFFVQSNANGSVTFSESHKTSGALPNTQYFGSTQVDKSIRLGIYDNLNNRTSEVVLNYSKAGTSWLNDFDAQIFGTAQSLVVYKDSTKLNFAALPDTSINDTVRLGVSIKAGSYSLKFSQLETIDSLQNISLIDNFLGTTTDVRSNPAYSFNVTTDSASKGANRFQIVLSGAVPLAVNFVGINATRNTNGVAVKWSVANEAKIAAYTVERSSDGVYFTTVNKSKATGSSIYTFQDASLPASASILYYRVKATDNLGKASYTNIVTVKLSIVNNQLSIFPNPVQRKLNLTIAGATSGSLYSVKITTATGKLAFTKSNVPVSGDAITFDASSFASGVYMIELTDVKGNKLVSKFVKE